MSMLTPQAPEGYAPPVRRVLPRLVEKRRAEVREILAHAFWLREHLGLSMEQATCSDAWVAADHYRNRLDVVALPGIPPCIAFKPGYKDKILLDSEMGPWEEAHVLAHEIGHSLFTRPGHSYSDDECELLAEAFACGFLLRGLTRAEERHEPCCRLEA